MPKSQSNSNPLLQDSLSPASASAWSDEQLVRGTEAIADDLRYLMCQLAECKSGAKEAEKKYAADQRRLLLELIEVSDAFERVFEHVESKKEACTAQMELWVKNFRTVYRLLWQALKGQSVMRIENLDGLYDPHWHIPQTRLFDPSRPEGTIVLEERRGYVWHGNLLRKSEVTVVTHNEDEANTGTAPDG